MNYELISIDIEKYVKEELTDLFEIDIVEKIINEGEIDGPDDSLKRTLDGQSFEITYDISPKLYELCEEVKTKLNFVEKTAFFIVNSSEINASAIPKHNEGDNNIIILTSRLVDNFDNDELKFIIGHEIGHIISNFARMMRVINFIYPDPDGIPALLINKITFWKRLSELTADRFGYIASPNLNKIVSIFFKLSSGLDISRISFNPDKYREKTSKIVESYKENPISFSGSHPINPIRVKALEYFSESSLYKSFVEKKELEVDEELQPKIEELVNLFSVLTSTDLDLHRLHFLATGGIITAMADGEIVESEMEKIISVLGNWHLFPHRFFERIIESKKVHEIFYQSIENIIKINPGERYMMLDYLIDLIIADRGLNEKELSFIYQIGKDYLQISKKEIAQALGNSLQKSFRPRIVPRHN